MQIIKLKKSVIIIIILRKLYCYFACTRWEYKGEGQVAVDSERQRNVAAASVAAQAVAEGPLTASAKASSHH